VRVSKAALDQVPREIEQFSYDRDAQAIGIVHFGIGAFHRAHQAWYTDRAMDAGDRDWAITGVSLRSPTVAEQMNPQDGLYTLTERSASGRRTRLIGAVREVLVGSAGAGEAVNRLSSSQTRIVSFTVTEKGYCRTANGSLDLDQAELNSFYPVLAEAFRRRRAAAVGGLTLLSCDNLAENGKQLARLMGEYLAACEPDLLDWFETECRCPSTMVDRIVPATTATDRNSVEQALGLRDEAAVVTEPFSQWVIEDGFAGPRPRWEAVGAELVVDVAPYETAKLRMLNGAHSALAYLGLERGHTFVHQAIADPELRPLIERLMVEEAATSFTPAPAQDLDGYARALLARFANPELNHRLSQIAMDGSQKIPQRWLATLAAQQSRGQHCPAILTAMAAWLRHLRGSVDDPLAEELWKITRGADPRQAAHDVFGPGGVLASEWCPGQSDFAAISQAATRSST
jgi:fructuronate reductase